MKNKKFDFRTVPYFPQMINILGIVLAVAGAVLIVSTNFIPAVICIMSGVIVLTTSYRLEIDLENKTYKDYVWFLGMKNGKTARYENIQYLFIKKSKISQQLNSRVSSTTITKDAFNAYLKFSEEEKIHLLTSESKTVLVKKLRNIANMLQVKIVDYSTDEPVVI